MPSKSYWYYPERVIYIQAEPGVLTLEEIKAGHELSIQTMNSLDHDLPVHFIFDMRAVTGDRVSIFKMREISKPFFQHPKVGWTVSVQDDPVIKFISAAISQVFNVKSRFLRDMDSVVEFLRDMDPTLKDLEVHKLSADRRIEPAMRGDASV